MYYVDPPETSPAPEQRGHHNFWLLIVPLACAGLWLGAVAMFFGLHIAAWCTLVVVAAVAVVGAFALLLVTERLDTLGIRH